MKFKLWIYSLILTVFNFSYSFAGIANQISDIEIYNRTIDKTIKVEKKRKKGGWQERMRQRIHKLIKAHDAFLIAFLICLFLLALCFMLGVYWIKNTEVLNALNYVSLGLVIITAFFAILWLMTVNMRRRP